MFDNKRNNQACVTSPSPRNQRQTQRRRERKRERARGREGEDETEKERERERERGRGEGRMEKVGGAKRERERDRQSGPQIPAMGSKQKLPTKETWSGRRFFVCSRCCWGVFLFCPGFLSSFLGFVLPALLYEFPARKPG